MSMPYANKQNKTKLLGVVMQNAEEVQFLEELPLLFF